MSDYVRYSIDAAQSQFTVHAFASGLAAVVAHNPKFAISDFSGEAQFAPDTLRECLDAGQDQGRVAGAHGRSK
jgi:hypothetical protein